MRLTHFFCQGWQDGGTQLVSSVELQELLEEFVPPNASCESDNELEYIATLLLETERTPATRIRGYFENVVPNFLISDSKFEKNF